MLKITGFLFLIIGIIIYLYLIMNIILSFYSLYSLIYLSLLIGYFFLFIHLIKDKIKNKEDKYYEDNINI